MYPLLFEIQGYKAYSYGTVMVLAFILCIAFALKYAPKNLLSHQDLYNFCLITMASLLMGTKLIDMFVHGNFSPAACLNLLKFWQRGSFSFFPALLLAIILIFIYCKLKKISFLKTMDYLFPFALLGMAIQRSFGCFLAGCCYGKPTQLPWAIIFPGSSRAGSHFPGTPIHPTQLYYGIAAATIFLFLLWHKKKSRHEGEISALGLMMLAASYFFITFFRGDIGADQVFHHISRSQYYALALLLAGLFILLLHVSKGKKYQNEQEEP